MDKAKGRRIESLTTGLDGDDNGGLFGPLSPLAGQSSRSKYGGLDEVKEKKMASEADDLLASLDAEFGKKPREKKERSKEYFNQAKGISFAKSQLEYMQFGGDKDLSEFEQANVLAKKMSIKRDWVPTERLTYVVTQHCDCCGRKVEFLGSEYVRFRSEERRATITRRAEVCTDLFLFKRDAPELPDLIEYITETVKRCPSCIRDEKQVSDLWDTVMPPVKRVKQDTLAGLDELIKEIK